MSRSLLLAASALLACSSLQKGPLEDATGARSTRLDNLVGYGFCSVYLLAGTGIRQEPYALAYNTTGQNGGAETRQSCPADLWAKVDRDAVKAAFHVSDAFKNGPRFWTCDWMILPVGAQRDFSGLKASWFGLVHLPENFGAATAASYVPADASQDALIGFRKGTRVYILDDPNGTPWVMQSFTQMFDPSLTLDGLEALGEKLRLPAGWRFRSLVLDQDLELRAVNGLVRVTQDNLQNTYAACFSLSSQRACNHQP